MNPKLKMVQRLFWGRREAGFEKKNQNQKQKQTNKQTNHHKVFRKAWGHIWCALWYPTVHCGLHLKNSPRKYMHLNQPHVSNNVLPITTFLVNKSSSLAFSTPKVEGANTNTPPKTNTYKRLPIANTLRPWPVPLGVGVSMPMEWRF